MPLKAEIKLKKFVWQNLTSVEWLQPWKVFDLNEVRTQTFVPRVLHQLSFEATQDGARIFP